MMWGFLIFWPLNLYPGRGLSLLAFSRALFFLVQPGLKEDLWLLAPWLWDTLALSFFWLGFAVVLVQAFSSNCLQFVHLATKN